MTITVHDFTEMTSFPLGWEIYINSASYEFGKGGLTITPTDGGYHWMFADEIPASQIQVIKLRLATPLPTVVGSTAGTQLGWMAQGANMGTASFSLRINGNTGELITHAGASQKASGITYALTEIKAIYVQRPTQTEMKIAIELLDGTLNVHVLEMPNTTYTMRNDAAGFLLYVADDPSTLVLSHLCLSPQQMTEHAFTDPKRTLVNLLSENWAEKMLDFTPKFSTDWYDHKEEMPQVVVSHVATPSRFLGIGQTPRRFDANYAIDVWSKGDNAKRWKMIKEVDRIIAQKHYSPGIDLDFVQVSSWRDLDEVDATPKIYRSQILVRLLYFKS